MPSRRKTIAVAAGLLAAADAFHCPVPLAARQLQGPSSAIRMATQPPPDAKLVLPKAKLEAAQVNSKQWGITEAQATGKQATSSKSEQDAAIKKAKELAKEKAAASKPQVGAGTVRLGTQTGVGRTLGTQPVPVSGKRLGTVRAGASPVKAKEPTPTAGGAAAAEDSSDPIVALVKKAGTKCWISESSGRSITNAEALAVVAMTMPLSEPELVSYLSRRGYTGETRDAMLAKVLVGRQGQLELTMAEQVLEKAANMFAQADMYQEEAEKLEKENQALIEKAQLLGPDILKFTEKIAELQGEMAPWEWVPEWVPLGPRAEIAETQEKLDKLTDERKALDEQIEELEGEIADKRKNCNWDREDAGILRDSALRDLNAPRDEEASAIEAAEQVLTGAEAALRSGGKAAALAALLEGSTTLEKIDLRPDKRASPNSLPGRLHMLLTAPSVPSRSAASAGGSNWLSRLIGV